MSFRECCRQTKRKPSWGHMRQHWLMPKRSIMSCVKMPSGLPIPLLTLQGTCHILLLWGLEMAIGMKWPSFILCWKEQVWLFASLFDMPTSTLNKRCTCFRIQSTPYKNYNKSRIKLTSFRNSIAGPWNVSPTTTYCCQLHQAMMLYLHQKGELIALLPRHWGGMCMPMTWLI